MAQDPMNPLVIENDAGDRMAWNGQGWAPIGNKNARGAPYLSATVSKPDKSEAAYFNNWRKGDDASVNSAMSGIARARRMEGLLQKQKTGGIYAVPVLGTVAGMFDPEIREMDAIQSEVARGKRTPGEGAISDYDAKQFLAMTYGKDKPTETNRALVRAQRMQDDAALQRRQFMEWHYNTFGKASGASEAWQRYAQDNPIFDPSSETAGRPILNSRRENWRQYFGVTRSAGDARGSQAQEDIQRSAAPALPKGALEAYRSRHAAGRIDLKAKMGTASNPYVARDEATLNKLPPGSYVVAPDGSFGQVR